MNAHLQKLIDEVESTDYMVYEPPEEVEKTATVLFTMDQPEDLFPKKCYALAMYYAQESGMAQVKAHFSRGEDRKQLDRDDSYYQSRCASLKELFWHMIKEAHPEMYSHPKVGVCKGWVIVKRNEDDDDCGHFAKHLRRIL